RLDQIAKHVAAIAVEDQRAGRHIDDQVLGVAAVTVVGPARTAARSAPVLTVDDRGQAVGAGHGADDDRAAMAAVAAVGTALGDVLLPAEAHRAVAAV